MKQKIFLRDHNVIFVSIWLFITFTLPQHWDVGVPLGALVIYFEELFSITLFIFAIILTVINKQRFVIDKLAIALSFFIFLGVLFGVAKGNLVSDILRDSRVLLFGLLLHVYFINYKPSKSLVVTALFIITISSVAYFFQILISFLYEDYLFNWMDESMSLGLKRIGFANSIVLILFLPLAYMLDKKLFFILFAICFLLSLLYQKRVEMALCIMSLMLIYPKQLSFYKLFKLLVPIIAFVIMIVVLVKVERLLNVMDGSFFTRLFSIQAAFEQFLKSPITGYGFGELLHVTTVNVGGIELHKLFIDNSYLTVAVKLGCVGLFLFFFVYKCMWDSMKGIKEREVFFMMLLSLAIFSAYFMGATRTFIYVIMAYHFMSGVKFRYD